MPELVRWGDDRLDELAAQVRRNAERLEENAKIREELIKVRERLANVGGDTHDCITELREFKRQTEARARKDAEDQAKRDQLQHEERKADRRWMIGTLLATATLIVGALAVFVG